MAADPHELAQVLAEAEADLRLQLARLQELEAQLAALIHDLKAKPLNPAEAEQGRDGEAA